MGARNWCLPQSVLSRGANAATVLYILLFVVATVFAWVSRDVDEVAQASEIQQCEHDLPGKSCFRKEAALRMLTGSLIYLLPQALVVACARACSSYEGQGVSLAHAGLWPLRVPFWLLSFLLSLYVYPWVVIKAFFYVSAVLATLFLICQAVLVLSTAFRAWELLDKWCGKRFIHVALALTTMALLASLVMMGFLYASFAPQASCARNICFITFTLLICLALIALTIFALRVHEGGLIPTNLFTVAVLCPYLFWLCASALANAPQDDCSPEGPDKDAWYGAAWPMFAIGIVALLWSGCSGAWSYNCFLGEDPATEQEKAQNAATATAYFHFMLVGATGLMAMALSNWSLRGTPERWQLNRGATSMWMKMASQWVCALLYTITVVRVVVQGRQRSSVFRSGIWR